MSSTQSTVEHGYLLLADISGYTAFLAQTELEHANEILTDLLETVMERVKSLLTIHKIEGDSVFAHSSDQAIIRGETMLELIEATYVDFRGRLKNVRRHTTCTCRACQSIPMLDLKFMAHHGEYAVQNIGGRRELAGTDVNLAHRLLKNHITERTGWRAYALFTEAALDHMGLQLEDMFEGTEAYEHLGETRVFAMDMHPRYQVLMEKHRVVVEPSEAIYTSSTAFDAPPPVVWTWLNEPQKRALYMSGPGELLRFVPVARPGGRTSVGAVTHCVHGKDSISMREWVLDWKPFDYFTVQQQPNPMLTVRVTYNLEPRQGGGTRLAVAVGLSPKDARNPFRRFVTSFVFNRVVPFNRVILKMKSLMEAETSPGIPEASPG